VTVIGLLEPVTRALTGYGIGDPAQGWLFLAPIHPDRASYSPLLVFVVTGLLIATAWLAVRLFYHGRVRRSDAWGCGFPEQTARMQDTAEGFGQPVRHVFEPFFRIETHVPAPRDARPRYSETNDDRLWHWLYLPVARGVDWLTGLVTVLQRGRISVYLLYSFATLLVLLLFVR
jgi:hydrogenase-4 component B